jgi:hypothetical protein
MNLDWGKFYMKIHYRKFYTIFAKIWFPKIGLEDGVFVAEPTWITPAQVRDSTFEGFNVLQTV